MAHTNQDTVLLPDSSSKEVKEKVLESEGGVVEVAETKHVEDGSSVAGADPHVEKTIPQNSSDAPANLPLPRPSLVPLGSSNPQGSALTPTAPHPKKFNTVNISKKFLERNSSASASVTSTPHSSAAKSGSPAGVYLVDNLQSFDLNVNSAHSKVRRPTYLLTLTARHYEVDRKSSCCCCNLGLVETIICHPFPSHSDKFAEQYLPSSRRYTNTNNIDYYSAAATACWQGYSASTSQCRSTTQLAAQRSSWLETCVAER